MARFLEVVVERIVIREGAAPRRIVLTHPANWGEYRRELFAQMAASADLGAEVTLLTEPEAAAIDYAERARVSVGAIVAVYDLGGGTFDAAVLRRDDTGFTFLGPPQGVEQLGGIDIDAALFEHVVDASGIAALVQGADDPTTAAAMAQLHRACVEAKIALSDDTETTIGVFVPGSSTQIHLTRSELEELAGPLVDESVRSLERAVTDVGVEHAALTSVLLVGGSSRIPLVAQRVTTALGRPVAVDADPKASIARGAARAAAIGLGRPAAVGVTTLSTTGTDGSTTEAGPSASPPEDAVVDEPRPSNVDQPVSPTSGPRDRTRRSRGRIVGAAAALAAVVGAVAFALLWGGDGGSDEVADDEVPGAAAGDGAPGGGEPGASTDDGVLRIGAVLPLTGGLADSTETRSAAMSLAAADVEAGGGVLGGPIEVEIVDAGTDRLGTRDAVESLLTDGTIDAIVVDTSLAATAEGALPPLIADGRPACLPQGVPVESGVSDVSTPVLRLAGSDAAQSAALVELADERGAARIGLAVRDDGLSEPLAEIARAELEAAGIEVAGPVAYPTVDPDDDTFASLAGDVDAMVVIGTSTGAGDLFAALRSSGVGLDTGPVLVNSRFFSSTLLDELAADDLAAIDALTGVRLALPSSPDFDRRLREETGSSTIFAAESYDCVMLMALAATAGQSTAPDAVAAGLVDLTTGGTPCGGYQECRLLIEDGEDVDVDGVSGVDLNPDGAPVGTTVEVWQVEGSELATVREIVFDET